ncbi:DUF554 family protein [bacterium]|nr:DUF554 family protein [bacterium]
MPWPPSTSWPWSSPSPAAGILGHLLGCQRDWTDWANGWVNRFGGDEGRISRGFVTASLLFCVAKRHDARRLHSGRRRRRLRNLAVKSMLDFFASMALASALGWGVLLSVLTIIVYQGGPDAGRGVPEATSWPRSTRRRSSPWAGL